MSGSRTAPPEDSRTARRAVLVAAIAADLGLAVFSGLWLVPLAACVAMLAGFRYSERHRAERTPLDVQLLMALLMLGALGYLVGDLFLGLFGDSQPQTEFAVVLQAISSFGLRSRRNLYSHLWISLVIVFLGGLFAWTPVYLTVVAVWAGALAITFGATRGATAPGRGLARPGRWMVVWAVVSIGIFLALPEVQGTPLELPLLVTLPHASASITPLPPILPIAGADSGQLPAGGINLRARGPLGNQVVFDVRTPASGYWRAYALETYNGQSWAPAEDYTVQIAGEALDLTSYYQGEPSPPQGRAITQTFYLKQSVGNDLIGTYPIADTYFPSSQLNVSDDGTLQSPSELGAGDTYAVTSLVRDTSPPVLDDAPAVDPSLVPPQDLQLPQELPQDVRALAHSLVTPEMTEYQEVVSVTDYVRSHETYNLNAPVPPVNEDAVQAFLFDERQGFCEQFASAVAVMLRADGIPARLAIGYAGGSWDPVTGTYTVIAADAHAWDEVYFPTVGWVPFDATPQAALSPTTANSGPWRVASALFGSIGALPGGWAVPAAVLLGLAVLAVTVAAARRPRSGSRAVRRYAAAQRWLGFAGLPRRAAHQTPGEHLDVVSARSPAVGPLLAPLCDAVCGELYAAGAAAVSLGPLRRSCLLIGLGLRSHAHGRAVRR